MFRALLAHPQEVLHKQHLVYCLRIMYVGCGTVAVKLKPRKSRHLSPYARWTQSAPSILNLKIHCFGPIYGRIFIVSSLLQMFPPEPSMCSFSPQYMLHSQPILFRHDSLNNIWQRLTSGFRRVVNKIPTLLGCYAAYMGNCYRRFGAICRSHFQVSSSQGIILLGNSLDCVFTVTALCVFSLF
jgi:hypothetical protein